MPVCNSTIPKTHPKDPAYGGETQPLDPTEHTQTTLPTTHFSFSASAALTPGNRDPQGLGHLTVLLDPSRCPARSTWPPRTEGTDPAPVPLPAPRRKRRQLPPCARGAPCPAPKTRRRVSGKTRGTKQPPEPCRKMREAVCLPVGDTTLLRSPAGAAMPSALLLLR